MSRSRKKNKSFPFVMIYKEMIKSPAYKKLTNASRTSYTLLKFQCCKFGQDEVKFPYRHAGEYMDQHTFGRSIKQLIELGFIEKSFEGGLFRRTNIYKFIEEWKEIKE